ncbi:MAG: DUF2442 domain-containing protein [Mangrovibacterium sp.]
MKQIKNIWFENERIYLLADDDKVYSRPLEAFPILKEAEKWQRDRFEIYLRGTAIRWEELDEDIHMSSFLEKEEPEYNNEIARIFNRFGELNVSAVAQRVGIDKSLLLKYIYGIKKPNDERTAEIKVVLREVGERLVCEMS